MKRPLGDILVQNGKLSAQDLDRALAFQMREVRGSGPVAGDVTEFLLEVARKKYNQRDRYYLGRILTELKLLPEEEVREALEAQKNAPPPHKPRSRLQALREIMERMNSSYNLIELLHQVLVMAAQLVEAEGSSLIVSDRARGCLVIVMPTGPGAEAVRDQEVPQGAGIAGWVHAHGRSVICNDPGHDARFFAAIDTASGYTTRQILCVPLTVKGRKLGAIEVVNKTAAGARPAGFTPADRWLLELFSAQAAVAIENTRLAMALAQAEEDVGRQSTDLAAARMARAGGLVARSLLAEMRRALVPLQGYAARMLERLDDARLRKYQQLIDREMRGLLRRAEDVHRFLADGLRPELRDDSLVELLRELQSRAWVDCRTSGIQFELDVKEDARLAADREMLLAALLCLFRNSREAMSGGGTFTARAELLPGRVAIDIEDTGPGIPGELEGGQAAEPFVTRGKPYGAGLGLALAKKIVELHGGTLEVSNRVDPRGTRVRITLPAG